MPANLQLRARRRSAGRALFMQRGRHSPSGTSSRPLSAMIASVYADDYWRSTVVEERCWRGEGGGDRLDTAAAVVKSEWKTRYQILL
jgi:hypothetical protein